MNKKIVELEEDFVSNANTLLNEMHQLVGETFFSTMGKIKTMAYEDGEKERNKSIAEELDRILNKISTDEELVFDIEELRDELKEISK